jgi:photosynthetic reaction center H subunit
LPNFPTNPTLTKDGSYDMKTGAITEYIDVAQLVLYAFWIFFFGLVYYLRREDKREGYPLESDRSNRIRVQGFPPVPDPKKFILPHGGGVVYKPAEPPPQGSIAAEPVGKWPGAPLQPTGNPMVDGVGPGSYATRPETPDLTHEGEPRIVPMRLATQFYVEERDPDPRGKSVYGADNKVAGTVTEIWVDRGEPQIRYLEVKVDNGNEIEVGGKSVLLPINFVRVSANGERINVVSIRSDQFKDVPTTGSPDQVTLQEEDKICAYYGSGHLYAYPSRAEPML